MQMTALWLAFACRSASHPLWAVRQWQKLAEQIANAIAARDLQPGDELPPFRAAATALGVNPKTVERAYRFLSERGDLVRFPNRHYEVAQPLRYCDFFSANEQAPRRHGQSEAADNQPPTGVEVA